MAGRAYGSGMSYPTPPIYLNHEMADLIAAVSNLENRTHKSWVRWSGLNNLVIPKNFILKAWFYPSRTAFKLLKLSSVTSGEDDFIDVIYNRGSNQDFITVETYNGTHIDVGFVDDSGDPLVVNPNSLCFLWLKRTGSTWDVRVEVLNDAPDVTINWNTGSTAIMNASTDIPYKGEDYGSYVPSATTKTNVGNTFNSFVISNGMFDHITITENTNEAYNNEHTDVNDKYTIFNCNFQDNIICLLLNKPIIRTPIQSFDANRNNIIYFDTEEEGIVKNRLQITDDAGHIIYDETQINYAFEHTIPSDTLVNGRKYYAKLKDYTRSDAESYWSDTEEFWCYSDPILTCNIHDGDVIKNSSVGFRATYNQIEGEKAKWLTIDVYQIDASSGTTLVGKSGKLTNTNTPPITFAYNCMVHSEGNYYAHIELETVTNRHIELDVHFVIDIDEEKEQDLNVEDNCTGYIDVTAYPNVLGGGVVRNNPYYGYERTDPIYIDNEKLEMISCVSDLDDELNCFETYWSNVGFEIPTEFILSCWFSPSRTGNKLLKFYSITMNEYLELWYERGVNEDYVVVKTQSGALITQSFKDERGNGVHVTINDACFLWLKVTSGQYDLRVRRLKQGNPILIYWDKLGDKHGSNAQLNVSTDIPYLDEDYGSYVCPTNIPIPLANGFDSFVIANGVFDHINVNKNTSMPYSEEIPTVSTSSVVINCAFKGTLSCSDISATRVIFYHTEDPVDHDHPETSVANWVKLSEQNLTPGFNDIAFPDLVVKSNIETAYKAEYYSDDALVNTAYAWITPHFNKVYISDRTRTFKFEANVVYSNGAQNMQVGQIIPLGSKYPIIIQNSMTNYKSGNISMTILGANYENTRALNREDIRAQAEDVLDFLTNKKAKLLKDYNGNIFIFRVVNTPTINYNSNWGNGMINIGFDWVEVAEYHDLNALRELGFYDIE